ncbi:MAG TPA: hypothetical protein VJU84_18500 [Pyrinomonadaceae bacterium]|nr:hypothetical protein [Pyrinomonadaceae bacterium]
MSSYEHSLRPSLLSIVETSPSRSATEILFDRFRLAIARVFSCRHRRMGRPFTRDGLTYRTCLGCGMRRGFDLTSWSSYGPYYCASATGTRGQSAASSEKTPECTLAIAVARPDRGPVLVANK